MIQLKPQDIVLATKLLTHSEEPWSFQKLGKSLGVGHNQAHLSFKRLVACNLVSAELRLPIKNNLLEFFVHAIRYIFPAEWEENATHGIATSSSSPTLNELIKSGEHVVWPTKKNKESKLGKGLIPIHPSVIVASKSDEHCYQILSVSEALRTGGAREREVAAKIMKDLILGK